MPGTTLPPSQEDVISRLLARVERLERKLQAAESRSRFEIDGGIWKYLGSPGAEVLIDTAVAPDLQDFEVRVGTGSPHSFFEIWDAGAGVGDSFATLTTTGDLNLLADGNISITIPSSNPGGFGNLWQDSGTVKIT